MSHYDVAPGQYPHFACIAGPGVSGFDPLEIALDIEIRNVREREAVVKIVFAKKNRHFTDRLRFTFVTVHEFRGSTARQ